MATKRTQAQVNLGTDAEQVVTWIAELDGLVDRFNNWEREFYANVTDQFLMQDRTLSPMQRETLEKMYRKYC